MKRAGILIVLLVCVACGASAQELTAKERSHLRKQRQATIDLLHVGVGVEGAFWNDWQTGLKASFGVGSTRHIGSVDVGLKYLVSGPLSSLQNEHIILQQMPFFLSAELHAIRWEDGCLYVGGEAAYHVDLAATHRVPATGVQARDKRLRHHHASVGGKLGFRHRNWDLHVFYTYDLMPKYNQKYVYESAAYDYEALRGSLFERMRVGVSFGYVFPLSY